MKERVVTLFVLAISVVAQLCAAPARRNLMTITQPDGTTVNVRLCGDEYHHFYMSEEGEFVTRGEDGYFYFTTLDSDNNLVPSRVRLGDAKPVEIDEVAVMKRHDELNNAQRRQKSRGIALRRAPMRKTANEAVSSETVKGLIILVDFQDKSFITPQSTINDMMNKEGYTDDFGTIGSARDYFKAQSYGQFVPDFDVVGPIKLSRNMSYYGGNDNSGVDKYPDVMVSEACELASEQGLVDMSDYDIDGDGWVDLIYVIYAGYAESSGASSSTVWPHAWYIYQGAGRTVEVDGVYLDAYACSSELNGNSGSDVDGIGTFCHEYSHTLGLPDFYDIDYSGGMGMSYWSIMDSGCYVEDGYVPIGYSAFERYSCGWITLNELTQATSVVMPDLNTDKTAAYRISSNNENQFITLETRSHEGWDIGLPAEGMMVTAIDYDAKVWNDNAPNDNASRQRVKLIPADNKWSERNLEGDLYPYGGNDKLTSTSTPAMKVHNTSINGKPITNITYKQGVTTFDFMGGTQVMVEQPIATSAGNVTTNSFTAYWSPVNGAVSYDLYVERVDEAPETPEIAFEENFDGFTAQSSVDVTSDLDKYTMLPGWSGYKVFCYDGMVKLGSSKASGSLTTPYFSAAEGHTVCFDAASYNSDAESGLLTLMIDYYGDESGMSAYCELDMWELPYDDITTVAITSPYGADKCVLTFECDKRIFIDNLVIKNGEAEASNAAKRASIVIDARTGAKTRNTAVASNAKAANENVVFEGITTTYYNVTKVVNDIYEGIYRYKVRAVTNEGRSEWSNVIEVEIKSGTSIATPDISTARIFTADGTIYMHNVAAEHIIIYNMQGAVVACCQAVDGYAQYTPASAGIYLVRVDNSVKKVLVAD